jgi:uncharacterized membrane protein YedE/YeeE
MHDFTPLPALLGGITIGLAAGLLWLSSGQIAGISGILGGLLQRLEVATRWRLLFLLGMFVAALVLHARAPAAFDLSGLPGVPLTALGGLLVGVGTRLGSGCTSGHGVCGVGSGSRRSIVATLTFVLTGMLTVWLLHLLRGSST